jgi:ankyrin repeat protein
VRFLTLSLVLALTGCGRISRPISPLIEATRAGDTAQIKQLAAAGASLNAPGGVNNWTPLMHAIHKNQAAAVQALLEAGADPNVVSGRTTALIMAAGYEQADIVRILVDHGAIPTTDALTAAVGGTTDFDDYTAGKCQTDTVKALLAKDAKLTLPADSEAAKIAQHAGCTEVLALVHSSPVP